MEVTIETVSLPLSHSLTVIGLNVKLFSLDWIPWLATDIFLCDVYVLGTAAAAESPNCDGSEINRCCWINQVLPSGYLG